MANENPTLYSNFERVKDWAVEKFADKETLAYTLADVAFSGDYSDLQNTPDLTVYPTYAYVYSYVADAIDSIDHSVYVTHEFLSSQSYVTSTALSAMAYTTESYVMGKVNALIDGAPEALDTLNELAAAINDDANFASTVTTALGNKANSADVYSKTDIQNMAYITMANVSACGYLTAVPAEYITDAELSACGYLTSVPSEYITETELSGMSYVSQSSLSGMSYVTALSQAEMDELFPITNE